jgi:hypothetical protein
MALLVILLSAAVAAICWANSPQLLFSQGTSRGRNAVAKLSVRKKPHMSVTVVRIGPEAKA